MRHSVDVGVCRFCSSPTKFVKRIYGSAPGTDGYLFECTNKDCPKPGFMDFMDIRDTEDGKHPLQPLFLGDEHGNPTNDEIKEFLKELEPEASDSLGDLGCNMIQNALDAISEKFDLTDLEVEELSTRLGVGITFELEPKDED